MTRNQWIAIIAVVVLLLVAIAIGISLWIRSRNTLPIVGRGPKPINVTSIMPGKRSVGKAKKTPTLRTVRGRPA